MIDLKNTKKHIATAAVVFGLASSAHAAVMTTSTSAPGADGDDIAQLTLTNADWGTSVVWGDRPARGQTFTTTDAGTLNSLTVRSALGQGAGSGNYVLRVSTVSGTNLTVIATETAPSVAVSVDDYVTFTFDTPVALATGTEYAIDFARPSGSGFHSYRNTDDNAYAGGTAYSSGGSGAGGATISTHNHDRLFELDITVVPEPGSLALLGLGGLLIARRRRG